MDTQQDGAIYNCGQCEVDLDLHKLSVGGVEVRIGGRAFDVLAMLVRSPGQLVTKHDLKQRVWAEAVEDNSLQAHVSAIRKALGAERRLLKTVSGRGYRLLGNWVMRSSMPKDASTARLGRNLRDLLQPHGAFDDDAELFGGSAIAEEGMSQNLPARLVRTIGRDTEVTAISTQLVHQRFVSIVGPGGVGKTTLAVVVGHAMLERFRGAVYLINLGPVRDSYLVANLIAATLGVMVRTDGAVADIADVLRRKAVLVILDGCEHVIDHVAMLAEQLFKAGTQSSILVTSREPLGSDGEHVHYLRPLPCPPQREDWSFLETSNFAAVQLFLDRTAVDGNPVQLTDVLAPVVASICRELDGLPLAIELAAHHAATFGVDTTARQVADRVQLEWPGHQTGLRRHATLSAMLDWSHALLTDDERAVFRRLAVFPGAAEALDHIRFVVTHRESAVDILKAFEGLVSKSLVAADFEGSSPRYRLLVTTRVYARAKLAASGEERRVEQRYAEMRQVLPKA